MTASLLLVAAKEAVVAAHPVPFIYWQGMPNHEQRSKDSSEFIDYTVYGHMTMFGQWHHQRDPVTLFTFCGRAKETLFRVSSRPSVSRIFFSFDRR